MRYRIMISIVDADNPSDSLLLEELPIVFFDFLRAKIILHRAIGWMLAKLEG